MTDFIPGLLPPRHETGCRMTWPLPAGVSGTAEFRGDNREHRLTLERVWGEATAYALWLGMNPSGAESDVDDLTVLKEQRWTRNMHLSASLSHLGLAQPLCRYIKMNVGTYRWTDSTSLDQIKVPLVHPDNLPLTRTLAAEAAVIVLAIGNPPEALTAAACEVLDALQADQRHAVCLGKTKDGWPKHSSRLGYATPFEDFAL